MKYFPLLLLFFPGILNAQSPVQGKLVAPDTAKLSVIRIAPDSFPAVRIVFKAETKSGQPIWNLSAKDLAVEENGQPCKVLQLQKISKTKPVKVMLVVDHSGSMDSDARLSNWYASLNVDSLPYDSVQQAETYVYTYDEGSKTDSIVAGTWRKEYRYPDVPDWYKPPFYYARKGVNEFIGSVNTFKDSFGIIGFDNELDYRLPMTNNAARARRLMQSMEPDGGTAFYDAVMAALKQFEDAPDKELCAVIALTDGQDNSSHCSLNRVIREANKSGIPVYVIGLGDVNKKSLSRLAKKTNGDCYFTNNPKKLGAIYSIISQRVQSVYELSYASPNLASADTTREVTLQFNIDSLFLDENHLNVQLPGEVIRHLEELEAQKVPPPAAQTSTAGDPQTGNSAAAIGITVLVVLAGAGVLVARASKNSRQKNETLRILDIFPNPSSGTFTVTYQNTNALPLQLIIADSKGQLISSQSVSGNSTNCDLSGNAPGTYSVLLQSASAVSPAQQLVLIP